MISVFCTEGGHRCAGHVATYDDAVALARAQGHPSIWHLIERDGTRRAWTLYYVSDETVMVRDATSYRLAELHDSMSEEKLYQFIVRERAHEALMAVLDREYPVPEKLSVVAMLGTNPDRIHMDEGPALPPRRGRRRGV